MFNHAIAYVLAVLAEPKHDEKGASAVEYAILVAAIIGLVTAAVALAGPGLNTRFTNLFA